MRRVLVWSMRSLPTLLAFSLALGTCSFAQTGVSLTQPAAAPAIKAYHDGSIRDIDAIGNRNIGCGRGVGNWYSLENRSRWANRTPVIWNLVPS